MTGPDGTNSRDDVYFDNNKTPYKDIEPNIDDIDWDLEFLKDII